MNILIPTETSNLLFPNIILLNNQLIDFLNEKVVKYNTKDFIPTDPIQIPHLFTKKEDIAELCYFLTTATCQNITGSSIKIDGGWTAGK